MTNGEKFKEVFGFEINEGVCCVYEDDCEECFLDRYRKKEKRLDCTEGYWQSEYKEPKEERINIAERINLVNNAVEKTTAKWKQAIEDIETEINEESNYILSGDKQVKFTSLERLWQIITKHTKELM